MRGERSAPTSFFDCASSCSHWLVSALENSQALGQRLLFARGQFLRQGEQKRAEAGGADLGFVRQHAGDLLEFCQAGAMCAWPSARAGENSASIPAWASASTIRGGVMLHCRLTSAPRPIRAAESSSPPRLRGRWPLASRCAPQSRSPAVRSIAPAAAGVSDRRKTHKR